MCASQWGEPAPGGSLLGLLLLYTGDEGWFLVVLHLIRHLEALYVAAVN